MGTQFNIIRLVEVALADERSGVELYKAMANQAQSSELKSVFQELSDVEQDHAAQFEKLIGELKQAPPQGAYPDEYAAYLDALCAEGGQSDAFARISATKSDTELLNLAIEFEKEQLTLQRDIGDALGGAHKKIIDIILQEEKNHLVMLSRAKAKIKL